MTPEQRRIAQLEFDVRELTRRLEQIPRPVANATQSVLLLPLIVSYGTQFFLPSGAASGIYGLKYKTSTPTITSVPSVSVSANMANTYDGLAYCNTLLGAAWVICGNCLDSTGNFIANYPVSCPVGQQMLAWRKPIKMTCDTGGVVDVYRVFSV